jgi:hypothetical protein
MRKNGEVMDATVLKISLLTDGSILLNGEPATLPELTSAVNAAPTGQSVVWYYRENAAAEPPVAAQVTKLVTERRLPVRLSTKPDFSDTVQPQGSGVRSNLCDHPKIRSAAQACNAAARW